MQVTVDPVINVFGNIINASDNQIAQLSTSSNTVALPLGPVLPRPSVHLGSSPGAAEAPASLSCGASISSAGEGTAISGMDPLPPAQAPQVHAFGGAGSDAAAMKSALGPEMQAVPLQVCLTTSHCPAVPWK